MVYLDNSATTAVCRQAADKAYAVMTEGFGNPSSLHSLGVRAEQEKEAARAAVAAYIGATPDTITFTSGGTEANNLAILGGVEARQRRGRHILTGATEHPSVLSACARAEQLGYEVTRLLPGEDGAVTPEAVAAACRPDTVLCSLMLVNNETGACTPLQAIVPIVRRLSPLSLIHCDGVQAVGKVPVNVQKLGVDLFTLSGHKLHAPKGVGALYIRKGVRILPQCFGGGQERGLRSGTENLPGIAALGAAMAALPPLSEQTARFERLRERLLSGLSALPDAVPHLPRGGAPHIVNISFPGLRSETLLHFLAARDIFVSSGSACARGHQSPVLTAMGLPAQEVQSALRISFSRDTTDDDIDRLLHALQEATTTLIRSRR